MKILIILLVLASAAYGMERATGVEWRGILKLGSTRSFSLYYPESKQSCWLRVGESRNGIRLVKFDPEARELHIMAGSQPQVLRLREADGSPLIVISDAVVARQAIEESERIHSPTKNPRMRNIVIARRADGVEISPPSESTRETSEQAISLLGSARTVENLDDYATTEAKVPFTIANNDPNPRILSKNDYKTQRK